MFSLPTSWKRVPWAQPVALSAVVVLVTGVVLLYVDLGFTLHAILRREQRGEAQALALADLEARALNALADGNWTIAAAYVAMNHAHASGTDAPEAQGQQASLTPVPAVERLDQTMRAAHAFQCAIFAAAFGAVHLAEESDMQRTVGMLNATEFSRAMEGKPCGELDRVLEPEAAESVEPPGEQREEGRAACAAQGGCFMRFRIAQGSRHGFSQPHVYSYIAGKRVAGAQEEKAALFMARVSHLPPVGEREPPSPFAPFWRATIPEDSTLIADTLDGLGLSREPFDESAWEARLEVVRRATQGMPSYKGGRVQALAMDELEVGSRIAVGWLVTGDTPEEVLGYYEEGLGRTGLPVLSHRYNAHAGYVGYRDPETRELHLVSVLAQGTETAVFVSHALARP